MDKKIFIRGAASILDLLPAERSSEISLPSHSDNEALKKDLEQVGNDMFFAIESLPHEDKKKAKA